MAPSATEIGITPTTIRIGVIADVDTSFSPGLFQGTVDGVKGFASFMNANGGLAGRQVVVDFYDSKLNPDDARNGIVKACQTDYALVGTTALFVNNVDDMVACKDMAGAATGLPEMPELQTEPVQQQAKVSFPISPPVRDWSQPTESYHAQVGPQKWLIANVNGGQPLHGIFIDSAAVKSADISEKATDAAKARAGVAIDQAFGFIGLESQSQYTPVVQAIKSHASTYAESGLDLISVVKMRKEANVQGATSVKAWLCGFQCYDQKLLSAGGPDVEGEYVWTSLIPFQEASSAKGVKEYLDSVGAAKANGFGLQGFATGLLFRDSVNAIVKDKGVNGLTRSALLTQLASTHTFTGDGMLGNVDIAGNQNGKGALPCWAMLQVKNNRFERVYPAQPGTFDCSPSNILAFQDHLAG